MAPIFSLTRRSQLTAIGVALVVGASLFVQPNVWAAAPSPGAGPAPATNSPLPSQRSGPQPQPSLPTTDPCTIINNCGGANSNNDPLRGCLNNPACLQAQPQPLVLQPAKTVTSELVYAGWNSTWCGGAPSTSSFSPPSGEIAVGYTHSSVYGGWCNDLWDDIARGGVGFDMSQVSSFHLAHGIKKAILAFAPLGSNINGACIGDLTPTECAQSCINQIVSSGDPAWEYLTTGPNRIVNQGGGFVMSEPEGIDLLSDAGLNVPHSDIYYGNTWVDVTTAINFGYLNPDLHFIFEGNDESTNNGDGLACEVTVGNFTLTLTPDH